METSIRLYTLNYDEVRTYLWAHEVRTYELSKI